MCIMYIILEIENKVCFDRIYFDILMFLDYVNRCKLLKEIYILFLF